MSVSIKELWELASSEKVNDREATVAFEVMRNKLSDTGNIGGFFSTLNGNDAKDYIEMKDARIKKLIYDHYQEVSNLNIARRDMMRAHREEMAARLLQIHAAEDALEDKVDCACSNDQFDLERKSEEIAELENRVKRLDEEVEILKSSKSINLDKNQIDALKEISIIMLSVNNN